MFLTKHLMIGNSCSYTSVLCLNSHCTTHDVNVSTEADKSHKKMSAKLAVLVWYLLLLFGEWGGCIFVVCLFLGFGGSCCF